MGPGKDDLAWVLAAPEVARAEEVSMTSPPILVSMDPNEAARPRAELIREAIEKDEHFFKPIGEKASLPFDLRFIQEGKTLHIEIKDFSEEGNSDYLSSIISGHLWEQCLAAQELGEPMIIAVLGDDRDIQEAIRKAAGHEHKGHKRGFDLKKFEQYFAMADGFEANCIGAGIPVWHLGYNQFPRLLLRVRKILEGGDISGFAPKPSDGERQVVGLSILAGRGVGPKKARNILDRFNVCLMPKDDSYGYDSPVLEDCQGIGPKIAEIIRKNLEVVE
jgi:hypothetical protein